MNPTSDEEASTKLTELTYEKLKSESDLTAKYNFYYYDTVLTKTIKNINVMNGLMKKGTKNNVAQFKLTFSRGGSAKDSPPLNLQKDNYEKEIEKLMPYFRDVLLKGSNALSN